MHLVAYFGLIHLIGKASQRTVDDNSKDSDGRTPLSWAASEGHEKMVGLLLDREGINPNSKDNNGRMPLTWAANNGRESVVRLLLDRDGVNPDSKDRYGRT